MVLFSLIWFAFFKRTGKFNSSCETVLALSFTCNHLMIYHKTEFIWWKFLYANVCAYFPLVSLFKIQTTSQFSMQQWAKTLHTCMSWIEKESKVEKKKKANKRENVHSTVQQIFFSLIFPAKIDWWPAVIFPFCMYGPTFELIFDNKLPNNMKCKWRDIKRGQRIQ